ncbi:thiamine-binding protein, partial [Bacillus spizizenii]|nr:thiamine-binding protein [Bacillus spizizenii]
EGELSDLFTVIQASHESPFQKGLHRVATNIRIDDRRDKKTTLESKIESVNKHLQQ